MSTTHVTSAPTSSSNAAAEPLSPPASLGPAGLHLPSYLLGLTTALILSGGALFFWPRPQPAALQLQAPPALTATSAVAAPATQVPAATLTPTPGPLVVFVSGAVAQPGLYTLAATARIGDAIAAAGGLLPGVDGALINQAQRLIDGAQLHIPAPTPAAATPMAQQPPAPPADGTADALPVAAPTAAPTAAQPSAGLTVPQAAALPTPTELAAAVPPLRGAALQLPAAGALINVNTATGPELEALPGIGPAKAQAIIGNRPYATVEELDRVPGIGPATLEQIRGLVTCQ